jgi:hypothetical protein
MLPNAPVSIQPIAIRAHYYTTAVGDESKLDDIRKRLWENGFEAEVFKKDRRSAKSKAVDICFAKDVLSNAFLGNYDAAVLIAGDADYLPIVKEVKRLGKLVYVVFFHGPESGLSLKLHLASDQFFNIADSFLSLWGGPVDERTHSHAAKAATPPSSPPKTKSSKPPVRIVDLNAGN